MEVRPFGDIPYAVLVFFANVGNIHQKPFAVFLRTVFVCLGIVEVKECLAEGFRTYLNVVLVPFLTGDKGEEHAADCKGDSFVGHIKRGYAL